MVTGNLETSFYYWRYRYVRKHASYGKFGDEKGRDTDEKVKRNFG
ncbi:MAG: hypothetical protein Ct9H90mP22_2580 [Gammaproteobacteria bacterium]|nr:MAG: hypothetical protein Ct9H90mP22_2580 [Gammaproteobacteria bacterium]